VAHPKQFFTLQKEINKPDLTQTQTSGAAATQNRHTSRTPPASSPATSLRGELLSPPLVLRDFQHRRLLPGRFYYPRLHSFVPALGSLCGVDSSRWDAEEFAEGV
jgi:hypothetical protein